MLLSTRDPVFVVDLSPAAMESTRTDFVVGAADARGALPYDPAQARAASPAEAGARDTAAPPEAPVRAIALVFDWDDDPVLLAIEPTRDTEMLDALARLLRAALHTGHPVSLLATDFGSLDIKRMYFAKRFPRWVYRGIPATVRHRVPEKLCRALGPPPR